MAGVGELRNAGDAAEISGGERGTQIDGGGAGHEFVRKA